MLSPGMAALPASYLSWRPLCCGLKLRGLAFLLNAPCPWEDYTVGPKALIHQQRKGLKIQWTKRLKKVARHFSLKKQQDQGAELGAGRDRGSRRVLVQARPGAELWCFQARKEGERGLWNAKGESTKLGGFLRILSSGLRGQRKVHPGMHTGACFCGLISLLSLPCLGLSHCGLFPGFEMFCVCSCVFTCWSTCLNAPPCNSYQTLLPG